MPAWKKRQPGCPCCSGPCTTSFYVTACCSPASGATVTVKTGSGTTVASGTTNSSGVVSLDLSSYTGQTLYSFVTFSTVNFLPYSGVLMGNFCGRTYNYDLTPVSDTIGTACGQVIVKTFGCDGVTPYGGINVSLYQSGTSTPIATGTTNATTGVYTFTGLTTGLVYYVKAGPTSRSQPAQTTSTFTLVCSEEADFVFNPTYPIVPTGTSCPASYTLTALTSGGTYQRGCCSTCFPIGIPAVLTLTDPQGQKLTSNPCGCSRTSVTATLIVSGSLSVKGYTCDATLSYTNTNLAYCPTGIGNASNPQADPFCQESGCSGCVTCSPYESIGSGYSLVCNGTSISLQIRETYECTPSPIVSYCRWSAWWGGNSGTPFPIYTASSFTCSPFAATFSIPAITLTPRFYYGGSSPCGSSITIPARTITVTQ